MPRNRNLRAMSNGQGPPAEGAAHKINNQIRATENHIHQLMDGQNEMYKTTPSQETESPSSDVEDPLSDAWPATATEVYADALGNELLKSITSSTPPAARKLNVESRKCCWRA